ncbi:MAG: flagellar type III secretion system pore protein FliP [Planctomycetes bacterium]|nr:flagellar type III secretion system pore protein FliP [Planctomycetota bacterium]
MKHLRLTAVAFFAGLSGLAAQNFPTISMNFGDQVTTPGEVASTVEILFVLTILGLVPSILVMMTSFTRIIIVLGFLRRALGLQTMPPDNLLVGISLFITMFIMEPTVIRIYEEAFVPYKRNEGTIDDFKVRAMAPLRDFMFSQTRKVDLKTMLDLAKLENAKTEDDVPSHVLVPAFVISELTRSFEIGFLIYLPFFLIDMVVAGVLMSMGMMMLPPVLISLPFKILLFVLSDGCNLLIVSLVNSFYT